ncbi:hypothetical protein F53441_3399 [Fusarium austroafricanum]|uniref:DUF7580 domain-containing protein n=1 Tax=Fusarium austroafricanum TaxID=2364996 RepID=A0A8H4KMI5_9HYPO|nr:hypothetical protein F53441_3399 [Fusarium austroafricanum]
MSGFEIAGLILSAIPIAIETLKIGSQGLATLRRSRKYENEMQRLINRFENERVRLQDVCEKLLVDLVPHSQIEQLILNPHELLGSKPELDTKLRGRLWNGYEVFEKTLKEIRTAMDEATERINIQIRDKLNIRRSLRHSFLDDLLHRINEGISILEQLVQRSIELEPARKIRCQGRFLCFMRNLADELFGAVRASFDCPCEHHVCLQLEKRTSDIVPDDAGYDAPIRDIKFNLALSYNGPGINPDAISSHTRKWSEVVARPAPISQPWVPIQETWSKAMHRLQLLKSFGRSVFSRASPSPMADPIKVPDNSVELESVPKHTGPPSTILDLCTRIRQPITSESEMCYGMIFDTSLQKTYTYDVYSIILSKYREQCDRTVISLNEVLSQNQRHMVLSEQDRLKLAVVICSSLLQLYGSPWIPKVIRSQDIYLIQGIDDPVCDRFFVLQTLPHANDPSDEENGEMTSMRNQTLFYLGVLLIELAFGKPLELLRSDRDKSSTGSQFFTDYRTAKRLSRVALMESFTAEELG